MKQARQIKTTKKDIYEYWLDNSDISEINLNFDWADGWSNCWNCGSDKSAKYQKHNMEKTRLQRCHIVPHMHGGEDKPSNYVLLCDECHDESPDAQNPKYMWEWIKGNKLHLSFYGMYKIEKAMILFKKRKGYSFTTKVIPKLKDPLKVFNEEISKLGQHKYKIVVESYYTALCEIERLHT